MELEGKLKVYYITAIFGVVFAMVGFTYNAWRLEKSEENSNLRAASFEVLKVLSEFEQLIYVAHYDKDTVEGNPRRGWVKIGLIVDLSSLISKKAENQALKLKDTWQNSWNIFASDKHMTDQLVSDIDAVRSEIKETLKQLE